MFIGTKSDSFNIEDKHVETIDDAINSLKINDRIIKPKNGLFFKISAKEQIGIDEIKQAILENVEAIVN